jgi:hypothetical protein
MARILAPALTFLALPAMAHDGFHPHPHGIELGWGVAALVGLAAGFAMWRFGGRK